MLFQLEDAAIVGADAFKYAVAVQQPVIEHGHFCIAFVVIFSVDKNLRSDWRSHWGTPLLKAMRKNVEEWNIGMME